MGTMGDYSGDNTDGKKSLKERKFVNIDRDSFDKVMTKIDPQLQFKTENTLADDDSESSKQHVKQS